MRRNVGRVSEPVSKVSIGFSILPTMAKNGTRSMSPEQHVVVEALKARCPNMFKPCKTTVQEQGDERLYTSVQPVSNWLPNPSQLARVLDGNNLSLRVDITRKGSRAQSTHFRMTHNDIDSFIDGNPLQLCVLSDVVNNRNTHGKVVFERTSAGGFGNMHYEIGKENDTRRFTLF